MTKLKMCLPICGLLALSGLSGVAAAACIDSLVGTNATSVLDASGQGNFSCADMSPGPDGGDMQSINLRPSVTITPNNPLDPTAVTVTVDVADLPNYELDAVYIKAKGNGARCLYTFTDYAESGISLQAGGDSFSIDDVIVCADSKGQAPAEEPAVIEPVSTAGDNCAGQILYDDGSGGLVPLDDLAVVSAVSLDGQKLAVCSGDLTQQFQCVNVCKNFTPRADTPECSAASEGLTNGELDLDACRPCDLTDLTAPPAVDKDGNPVFYCWEYTNSVVRDPPLDVLYPAPGAEFVPGTEIPRMWGTLLPHKKAWSTTEETETYNGCYTKTVYLNGRAYTYTTCY